MKTTKITMMLLSAAMLTVACSKEESVSPPSSTNASSVTLKNEIDHSRLSSMNINNDIWQRSSNARYAGDIVVVNAPSIPAGCIDLTTAAADHPYTAEEGDVLCIPAGTSYDLAIGFHWSGSDLYVAGDLILEPSTWGKGTIYVLEGGSITFPAGYALTDIKLQSWGKINCEGNLTVNPSSAVYNYSENPIELSSDDHMLTLSINSNFESVGSVSADKIEIVGANEWEEDRIVKFGGCVSVDLLDLSNYGELYISNKGLSANDVMFHSYSNLYATENTLIKVTNQISFENYSCFVNLSQKYAVIDTDKVTVDNNTFLNRINGGPVDLNYNTIEGDNSETEIQWTANVVFNEKTFIPSQGCLEDFGTSTDDPKDPNLEHDKVITSPSIERISATSIDFHNGRVFVSWHEAEANYQGYIDVVNMESVEIEATLHTTELDFNHMYINNGIAYVTGGDNKNGAFYSEVAYNSGSSSVSVDVNYVGGSSGNCITIDGNNKWVVSGANGGLNIIDAQNVQNYSELPEAKFVEPYKNGMAVLAGISSTHIYEYDLAGNQTNSYHVGAIAPLDGKNTLHADGEAIYACLSTTGLVKVVDGVISPLALSPEQIGSVNCIDTDDEFIYIANGTRGLTIVDKATWKTVKEYTLGGASANYIKLGADGYIYVAYGLKGVHRFRLIK